ncbi:HlyD family secretion protein [methanotrophic endosymbiont of Bathymodiolus puteoserpentis (Logatchev)]|jgi:multidrug efflux pump subunit AcrA (membrane-fusion protein)|uniref:HlyD family secretion protein n=1 Tax=methanotrophic endosymbiont of Bathymodiolus puteoserpentis (Logatchev) TaxID=343235 RepID=UPI0013CA7732|nr:HlyD family efflux transporter periplasmic adaptor subunit [methanotrophic endosymbiont of Bathymodiolus puteoserpentis (Logatchev)]SHE21665.1 RND efflux membrane fusion protein [methanotrophic endosymbiont of Bathymodiolus puteoserpentis (Logatchev)]
MKPSQTNQPQFSVISASQTPGIVGRAVSYIAWLFVLLPIFTLFLPWQQNINGNGYISAYAPADRQQTIQSPISGRIEKWYVKEGTQVKKGDLLVKVNDIDPKLPERLNQQRAANQAKLAAKQQEFEAYQIQIERLETVRDMKVATAQYKLDMAEQKMRSASENLVSAHASYDTAKQQQQRLQRLLNDGLVSQRAYELAERDAIIARRSLNSAQASLQSTQAGKNGAEADINQFRANAQAKIDSTTATLNKISSELEDIRNSLVSNELNIARQSTQWINAPQDGTVLRLLKNPQGDIIKQGDPLLVLVPDTSYRAVEVWVSGNDAPLILPGHHVRLMFEGWPAVQFVGWPEVAVGTFGGTVAFVDASDNGQGKFRVLIVPDESDHLWPSARFLRQGGAAKAWILLEEVSIGFEIWRQLNGFPPMLTPEHPNKDLSRQSTYQ